MLHCDQSEQFVNRPAREMPLLMDSRELVMENYSVYSYNIDYNLGTGNETNDGSNISRVTNNYKINILSGTCGNILPVEIDFIIKMFVSITV